MYLDRQTTVLHEQRDGADLLVPAAHSWPSFRSGDLPAFITTNESRRLIDERLGEGEKLVAEVRYLYATEDEQLFQPVFVRLRDDKLGKACLRGQLVRTDRTVL